MQDACLALTGGEPMLQVPGFGCKSPHEVRRGLWLEIGGTRFVDRHVPNGVASGRSLAQKALAAG